MNRVNEAYEKACKLGQFQVIPCRDEYFDYIGGKRVLVSKDSECSDIVFTAYDGFHVSLVCFNKHAKKICDTVNSMHDESKIKEYFDYYREHRKLKS